MDFGNEFEVTFFIEFPMDSTMLSDFFKWILQLEEFYVKKEEIWKRIEICIEESVRLNLSDILYYPPSEYYDLPLPPNCLPREFVQEKLTKRDMEKLSFLPITRDLWWDYIRKNPFILETPSKYLISTLIFLSKQPDKQKFIPHLQKTKVSIFWVN